MLKSCLTLFMLVVLGGAITTGCAGTTPTRFYQLSSMNVPDTTALNSNALSIIVGPVDIPDYLDRPHLLTRSGQNEINVADFHEWAGPLREGITRVLAENFSALLSTDKIYEYPLRRPVNADYRIEVIINRFEGTRGETVLLKARWTILADRGEAPVSHVSTYSEQISGTGYDDLVSAMSRALEDLSREIAKEIKAVNSSGANGVRP